MRVVSDLQKVVTALHKVVTRGLPDHLHGDIVPACEHVWVLASLRVDIAWHLQDLHPVVPVSVWLVEHVEVE